MQSKTYLTLMMAFAFCLSVFSLTAQGVSEPPQNWFHLDQKSDGYQGVSTNRLYKEILNSRKSSEVIVAVIDSGVDWEHEDLSNVMWVNPGEIAGNGVDDDNNGYIDDIHGWNFIGGPNGNIDADNLEITRLYRKYDKMYGNLSSDESLSKKEKKEYSYYMELKEKVEAARGKAKDNLDKYTALMEQNLDGVNALKSAMGKKKLTLENVDALEAGGNEDLAMGIKVAQASLAQDPETTYASMKEAITSGYQPALDYFGGQYNHYYNTDFDPRNIVADDYSNQEQVIYGNNDFEGPDASHGTHVAGIIGAERNNGIGMDGVADNVRIMTIRAVPDGDERDKDVANAIRYAVDNGASVINMSFGKSYSWNKKVVDDAVKYACKNDVLLVHAAGNDGKNNDLSDNFPNDQYEKRGLFSPKTAKTWMEVGALNFANGEKSPAPFSNYGSEGVDIFAPGVKIYSTIPDNEYASFQGTSMASPVVAGVAALLRSYFPELSAKQVKDILMETSTPLNDVVETPGDPSVKVPFSTLSVSGGVVNAYGAVKKAEETKGKRKKSKAYDPKGMSDDMKSSKPRA